MEASSLTYFLMCVKNIYHARIAQSVEQIPLKDKVRGSIPRAGTRTQDHRTTEHQNSLLIFEFENLEFLKCFLCLCGFNLEFFELLSVFLWLCGRSLVGRA